MVRAMKRILLALAALAVSPTFTSAQVQASASFSIDLPIVLPRLVIVQPGIQVVPDLDVEVFFVDGFYWTQREGRWYRSKSHRGGWSHAERGVPSGLVRMQPGRYRRYRPPPAAARPPPAPVYRGEARGDDRHEGRHDDHGRDHDDRGGKHGGGKGHGKRD
jgi:hypothetical protein